MAEPEDNIPEDEEYSDELFEHHRIVADKGQAPLRVDKFLMNRIENATRSKIQNAAEAGNILVNGHPVKSNYRVKAFDIVTIVLAFPPRDKEIKPENIPLDIVYEDEHVIVINKPAGLVVHPGYGNYSGTLVNGLMYHFENLPQLKSEHMRPGLVHRIDKNTSGIIVLAKTEDALANVALQFFNRTVDRKYVALVWGDFEEDSGTITGHIGRSLKDRKIMDVFPEGEYGKHAITHYRVLERFGYVTLVECKLETGRTHQIRAHFRYIKHPLFNDEVYGGNRILKGTTFNKYRQFVDNCFSIMPRHALHAKSLAFTHPATGERMYFESEIAPDMAEVIERWRKYTQARLSGAEGT